MYYTQQMSTQPWFLSFWSIIPQGLESLWSWAWLSSSSAGRTSTAWLASPLPTARICMT